MVNKIESLNYVRDRYNEEYVRFEHIEGKCTKFLTILTIMIAAFGVFAGFNNTKMFKPTMCLEYLELVLFICAVFTLVCSWGHMFSAIKINSITVAPRKKEISDWLKQASDADSIDYIFDCYADATPLMEEANNNKLKQLSLAYDEIIIGAWLISSFCIIKIYLEMM